MLIRSAARPFLLCSLLLFLVVETAQAQPARIPDENGDIVNPWPGTEDVIRPLESDPVGCDQTGVAITIQPILNGNPTIGPILEGDPIVYRVRVSHPGGTACNFFGGQLSLTLPDGFLVQLAGFGGVTPDVPLIDAISPFSIDSPVAYIADRADADANGILTARTDYGATGFRPTQQNGTFLTDPNQKSASASTSIPLPLLFCGDGEVNLEGETCDPPGEPAGPSGNICRDNCTMCGDMILDVGEECDDGNGVNTDACRNSCTLPFCGDGIVDPDEFCDDGNTNNNDACRNDCTACGDGEINGAEFCDDGNTNNNDVCRNDCTACGDGIVNGGEECDDGNTNNNDTCRNDCTAPDCGDGIVDPDEECDDGNTNNEDGCRNDCTEPRCGDGIRDPGEECDDGNTNNADGCRNDCTIPICGDGILDAGEQCDDGNTIDNDACRNNCTRPRCGDGILNPGEQCDDGNTNNEDACRNNCTLPRCGDGILDPGEECDDGNNVGGDGCSPTCDTEPPDEVPAVSTWGMLVIALLLLSLARIAFDDRRLKSA